MPAKKPGKKNKPDKKAKEKAEELPPKKALPVKEASPDDKKMKEAKEAEEKETEEIDEEETETTETGDCKCQKEDGDYYCYKFIQGRWIQWSQIPFPTKKMCEASCCGETG